jgi:hypothetical protein
MSAGRGTQAAGRQQVGSSDTEVHRQAQAHFRTPQTPPRGVYRPRNTVNNNKRHERGSHAGDSERRSGAACQRRLTALNSYKPAASHCRDGRSTLAPTTTTASQHATVMAVWVCATGVSGSRDSDAAAQARPRHTPGSGYATPAPPPGHVRRVTASSVANTVLITRRGATSGRTGPSGGGVSGCRASSMSHQGAALWHCAC